MIGPNNPLFVHIHWAFQVRDTGKVPVGFRYHLLMLVILNFVVCVIWEKVVVEGIITKRTALHEKLLKMELIMDVPDIYKTTKIDVEKQRDVITVPCKLKKKS